MPSPGRHTAFTGFRYEAVIVLAIDPGTEQSGWAVYAPRERRVVESGVAPNPILLRRLAHEPADVLAIEMVASYGMPVGREVFETVRWIGRFQQAWREPEAVRLIYRRDVKLFLCASSRAKDGNIRQALIDRLGPRGTKANQGPTYGVKSHAWAALAVAVTAAGCRAIRESCPSSA
jgi:hypothetical protein